MLYILVSLISLVAIGSISNSGGGSGGSSPPGEFITYETVPDENWDGTIDSDMIASYKTTEYNNQWGLDAINAAEGYALLEQNEKAIAGDDIIIGITDSGVRSTHQEITSNYNDSGHTDPSDDYDGHGTHVASTAAGVKNNDTMHGVAFNAKILSVRTALSGDPLLEDENNSNDPISILQAPGYASDQGAKVVNMSWGSDNEENFFEIGDETYDILLSFYSSSSFDDIKNNDAVMVAAAGNNGNNSKVVSPAVFANEDVVNGQMIVVGAVDQNNNIASFSNRCAQVKEYCLVAPGVDINAAIHNTDISYELKDGTSMATPHVSGAAAVLRAAWPYLSANQTVQILLATTKDLGDPGLDDIYGRGMLDLGNAIKAQGPNNIAPVSDVQSQGYDARYSSIRISPIFGDAYSKNIAPIIKNAVFFDQYGRDYKANLDQKISLNSNQSYNLDNILFTNNSNKTVPISFGRDNSHNITINLNTRNYIKNSLTDKIIYNKFGLKYLTIDNSREDPDQFNNSNIKLSYSKNLANGLKLGFSKNDFTESLTNEDIGQNFGLISYNSFSLSPYKELASSNFTSTNGNEISSNRFSIYKELTPKLNTSFSYSNYSSNDSLNNFSEDKSRVFDGNINYQFNKKTLLGFSFGNLEENNNSFLGGNAQGAFSSGENPNTNYVTFNASRKLINNWHITSSYSQGRTTISGNNIGVFRDFNNVKSRGLALGIFNEKFFNGKLALVYSEPLRIYKGTTTIDIPIARDDEGNVYRLREDNVSLTPEGKEQTFELSYSFNLAKSDARVDFNSIIRQEPDNIKDADNQYIWMLRYNLQF